MIQYKKYLVNKKEEVILLLILEKLTHKVLIIIDERKLAGTITDGDIRRSIIKKKINFSESCMNSNCIYAKNKI